MKIAIVVLAAVGAVVVSFVVMRYLYEIQQRLVRLETCLNKFIDALERETQREAKLGRWKKGVN